MSRTFFLSFLITMIVAICPQQGHVSAQNTDIIQIRELFRANDVTTPCRHDVSPIYADTSVVRIASLNLFTQLKAIKISTLKRLDMADISKHQVSIIDTDLIGIAAYSFSEKRYPSYEEGCEIIPDNLTQQLYKLFKNRQVDFVEIWAFYIDNKNLSNGILWHDNFATTFRDIKGYNIFDYLISLFRSDDNSYMMRLDYEDIRYRYVETEIHQKGLSGNVDIADGNGRNALAGEQYWNSTKHCIFREVDISDEEHDFFSDKISASIGIMNGKVRYVIPNIEGLSYKEVLSRLANTYYSGCRVYLPELQRKLELLSPSYPDSCQWVYKAIERLDIVISSSTTKPSHAILYPVSPGLVGNNDFQKIAIQSAIRMGEELWKTGCDFVFISDEDILKSKIENKKLHHANLEISTCIVPYTDPIRWEVLCKLSDFANEGGEVVMLRHPQWTNLPIKIRQQRLDSLKTTFANKGCFVSFRNYRQSITKIPRHFKDISYKGSVNFIHRAIDSSDIFMFSRIPKGSEITLHSLGWPELWDIETGATIPLRVMHRDGEWITIKTPHEANDITIIVSSIAFANDTIELWKPDVFLKNDITEIEFLHRINDNEDFFMVRGIPKDAEVVFNAVGQPYLLDADTKKKTPLNIKEQDEERTSLIMPIENDQFRIIVFKINK